MISILLRNLPWGHRNLFPAILSQGEVQLDYLGEFVSDFKDKDIKLSLFVDPEIEQIDAAAKLGVKVVEIHTGSFANNFNKNGEIHNDEFDHLNNVSIFAHEIGLEVHAGHGLTFETARVISRINVLKELNIGHFIIGNSIFEGLENTIIKMRHIISRAAK